MKKMVGFIRQEIYEALPAFFFFLGMFQLGHVTRALLLEEVHVTVGTTTVAAVGALIVAKAVLVADALPFSNIFARQPLAYTIVWKSLIYWLITFAFRYLEELIPLARKFGGVAAGHERLLEEISWPHFWAVQLWVVFALLLYCTGAELARLLGKERFRALLFGGGTARPPPAEPG